MLETLDRLLKCLGPCRTHLISDSVGWEYSIGQPFPTPQDVEADRLYVQASLIAVNYRSRLRLGTFRFAVYGGVGCVGLLVAEDLREAIIGCMGCEVRDFDLRVGALPFPNRNSDRTVNLNTLTFQVLG